MHMNMDPNAMSSSSPWFTPAVDPNYPTQQPQQQQHHRSTRPQPHQFITNASTSQRFQTPPGSASGGISGTVGSSYAPDGDDDDDDEYANEPPLLEGLYTCVCVSICTCLAYLLSISTLTHHVLLHLHTSTNR